jgi:hypothetical protein
MNFLYYVAINPTLHGGAPETSEYNTVFFNFENVRHMCFPIQKHMCETHLF